MKCLKVIKNNKFNKIFNKNLVFSINKSSLIKI